MSYSSFHPFPHFRCLLFSPFHTVFPLNEYFARCTKFPLVREWSGVEGKRDGRGQWKKGLQNEESAFPLARRVSYRVLIEPACRKNHIPASAPIFILSALFIEPPRIPVFSFASRCCSLSRFTTARKSRSPICHSSPN